MSTARPLAFGALQESRFQHRQWVPECVTHEELDWAMHHLQTLAMVNKGQPSNRCFQCRAQRVKVG